MSRVRLYGRTIEEQLQAEIAELTQALGEAAVEIRVLLRRHRSGYDRQRTARIHQEGTANMTTKKTPLEELRDYYDTTDQSTALANATYETGVGEVLVSTSIRLPKTLMEAVRARAAEAGIPATTLMRQWITDRLDTDHSGDQVISVADIQQLIATRAHPIAS